MSGKMCEPSDVWIHPNYALRIMHYALKNRPPTH